MVNVLGLVACASSSPEPEVATQEAVQPVEQEQETDVLDTDMPSDTASESATTSAGNAQEETAGNVVGTEVAAEIEAVAGTENMAGTGLSEPQPSNVDASRMVAVVPEQGDQVLDSEVQDLPPSEPVDYASERRAAMAAIRRGEVQDFTQFWAAVDNDPLMTAILYDEVKPHGTNALSALGGGSTVSLKYTDSADETAKAAIKPDQDLRQTMYRSEIAYYRLCQILECSYDVPVTRPVRFAEDDFYALYEASSSKKNRGYRSKFEHLIWEKESGSKFIYAAYKEWITPFEFFPIEVTGAWSPYLKDPDRDKPSLETFIRTLLASARPDSPKSSRKLLEYLEGKTTRDVLHQISDMILIDYLTNNWDRFSGAVNNYGANCHIQPGGLIAIDNGAAFPPWHAPRVVRRLHMVETFSRTLVTNLRLIDIEELLVRLFPNPTHEERKSLDRFRERYADAMKYIDKLIAKKGEENVLVFD